MSVAVRPGNTEVTRTPLAASSARSTSANARSANLLAAYAPQFGLAFNPEPEFTSTTGPDAARSAGSSRRVSSVTANRFTSKVRRQESAGLSATLPSSTRPALCTSTSSRSMPATASVTASSSVMSTGQGSAFGSSSAKACKDSWSRPPRSRSCVSASILATVAPMPREAPVTRANGRSGMPQPYRERHRRPVPGRFHNVGQHLTRGGTAFLGTRVSHVRTTGPDSRVLRKVAFRLMPFLCLLYFVNYLDRVNIGFAGPNGMNDELGMTATVFGFASGIFFLGYLVLEVPSNLALHKFGARRWLARIMITWGIVATAMAFVPNATTLVLLRFLLGVAEAGFFPGIILYLTFWFPAAQRAKAVALFMAA